MAQASPLDRPFILFWGPKGPSVCFAETGDCQEGTFRETDFASVFAKPHFQAGDFLMSYDGYFSRFPLLPSEIYPQIKNGMSISISPDKKQFVYNKWVADTEGLCIDSLTAVAPAPHCILPKNAHFPFWVEANRILYRDGPPLGGNTIFAVSPTGKVESKPIFTTPLNIYTMNLSPSGQKIVLALSGFVLGTIDWKTGEQIKWGEHAPGHVLTVKLSPDEKALAYVGANEIYDQKNTFNKMNPNNLWVIDAPGKSPRALLKIENKEKPGFFFGKGYKGVGDFAWSPDGTQLVFTASLDGDCSMANEGGSIACKQSLYLVNQDGSGFKKLGRIKSAKLGGLSWIVP